MKKIVKIVAVVCCLMVTALAVACTSTNSDVAKIVKDFNTNGWQEVTVTDVTKMYKTLDDVEYLGDIYRINADKDLGEGLNDLEADVYVFEEESDVILFYSKRSQAVASSYTVSQIGNKVIVANYESYSFVITLKSLSR